MKKLKLYLDTSIINFALADDIAAQDRDVTIRLCDEINKGKYEGFISDIVVREIVDTPVEARREQLLNFIKNIDLDEPFEVTDEVIGLADTYMSNGIIPKPHRDDALHIALATVNDMDILVSWNFKHLVRHKTRMEVSAINALMGYRSIDICTPWEVIEDV